MIIAVFLYRFGWEDLGTPYVTLGQLLDRKPSTILYRLANFLSYDGIDTGLNQGGKPAQAVYEQHKDMPRDVLRTRAIQALLSLASRKGGLTNAKNPGHTQ